MVIFFKAPQALGNKVPDRSPDQPEPKRLLFTAEHAGFFLRDLCALCGDKKYFAGQWQD
jgi:hypothetical protein